MKAIDPDLIRQRARVLEAHLARIAITLPDDPAQFKRGTDALDVVSLNLLCAIQVVLDLAVYACIHFGLQAPASYDDAVARLGHDGRISEPVTDKLEKAANFRDAFVHAFAELDGPAIYRAARVLPEDLRTFMADLAGQVGE